jgi:hypothetical protein
LSTSNDNKALFGNISVGSIVGVASGLFVVITCGVIGGYLIVSRRKTSDVDRTESDDSAGTVGPVSREHSDTVTAAQTENRIRDGGELKQSFPTASFSIDAPIIGFY